MGDRLDWSGAMRNRESDAEGRKEGAAAVFCYFFLLSIFIFETRGVA